MNTITEPRDYSVLIADDDDDSREALRSIVEPAGLRALLARSGEEALDILGAGVGVVHLALFDMHMPHLTGLETLRLARQLNAVLPCILITGDASDSVIREASQASVYSVIPKPISKSVVLYTVLRALARFYGQLRERHE
jgi:CheY-like chemotaxis protein